MNKFAIRLLTLAMLSLTLVAAPVVTVVYAAPDNDPPPPDKSKKKKSSEAQPGSQQTQVWYERALKADPNHVKTWQYYGLWQVEQGNRESAQYHLSKIAQLTGTSSDEYRSLAAALEKPPGTGLVY
jgi:cytochrome c-type biogenesis protein CcmH/NrfG